MYSHTWSNSHQIMSRNSMSNSYTSAEGEIVVLSPSRVQLFVTPWTAAHQASLSLTTSGSLTKFMSIASVITHLEMGTKGPNTLSPNPHPQHNIIQSEGNSHSQLELEEQRDWTQYLAPQLMKLPPEALKPNKVDVQTHSTTAKKKYFLISARRLFLTP